MKQQILPEDLNKLSEKDLMRLAEYTNDKGWNISNPIKNMPNGDGTFTKEVEHARLHLLSIGQSIEFLDEHEVDWVNELYWSSGPRLGRQLVKSFGDTELCDALWKAVVEVLEKI